MRSISLFLLLAAGLSGAVSNTVTIKELSGSNQSGRAHRKRVWVHPGEVPGDRWVRPYLGSSPITTFQAHRLTNWTPEWCTQQKKDPVLCPGSSQSFQVFWSQDHTANASDVVTFRVSDVPCSGGPTTEAGCAAAGLTLAGALALSAWEFSMEYTSTGDTGVTVTKTVRQMLTDENACIVYAGPAATVIDAGWQTGSGHVCTPIQSRPYAFGYAQKKTMTLSASVNSSATTFPIISHPEIAGLSFPQAAIIGTEKISITAATATSLTVSRAQDGTTASSHGTGTSQLHVHLIDGKPTLTATFDQATQVAAVSDASGITAGDVIRIRDRYYRTCDKIGNSLSISSQAVPCTTLSVFQPANDWYGSNTNFVVQPVAGYPVTRFNDDLWIAATADGQKSLSPRAILYFPAGYDHPGAQLITMNNWMDRKQSQWYNVAFKANGATVGTRNIVSHSVFSMTVFPDTDIGKQTSTVSDNFLWASGETPGKVHRDHNLAWLRSAGVVQIDPATAFTTTSYDSVFTGIESLGNGQQRPGWDGAGHNQGSMSNAAWLDNVQLRQFDSFWIRDEGGGGAYGGLGEYPRWHAQALLLMGKYGVIANAERYTEILYGPAQAGFHAPIYPVSVKTTGTFCGDTAQGFPTEPGASCTTPAYQTIVPFGRSPWSDGEPNFSVVTMHSSDAQGRLTRGGWTHNQSFGSSHWFNYFTVAYMLSADPLWEIGLQMNGASAATHTYYATPFVASAADAYALVHQNRMQTGLFFPTSGARGVYRSLNMVGNLCALLPPGPEKEIACSKYLNNLKAIEGKLGMTEGQYYNNCTTGASSSWECSGWAIGSSRHAFRRGAANTALPFSESLAACGNSATSGAINVERTRNVTTSFQYNYLGTALKTHVPMGLHHGWEVYRYTSRQPVNMAINAAAHAAAGTSLGVFTPYLQPEMSLQPEGVDIAPSGSAPNCSGQGEALGSLPAYTSWEHFLKSFHSSVRAPSWRGATDEYPNLLGDRIYLAKASVGADTTVPVEGFSMKKAWQAIRHRSSPNTFTEDGTAPNMNWSPEWYHTNKDVQILPGTTTARVVFLRPDTAVSCSYVISTVLPGDPTDSGDTSTSTRLLEHVINLAGLTTATPYWLRITCKDTAENRFSRSLHKFTTN